VEKWKKKKLCKMCSPVHSSCYLMFAVLPMYYRDNP